jgi:acyl dehydratase
MMSLREDDLKVGDERVDVVCRALTRTQITQYAGASGDFNPLHTDEDFAVKVKGFPSVFAHGMLTMGLTARVLTDWVGDGRLTKFGARFARQVWPGDTLTTTVTVEQVGPQDNQLCADFRIVTRNQHGADVLTGYATARLDPAQTP